jgi:ubiquinone/menaquinone biosynthesis C-methylase UbiE
MTAETEEERALRERRRVGFEQAAERYDATRCGYPEELVSHLVEKSQLVSTCRVLEIGCGTGQLTRALVERARIIAIDPAPSMIAVAQRRVPGNSVEYRVTTFEDFETSEAEFDLIVSGTAFHWVDPRIAWTKSARLLRASGWLALLSTGEKYDAPIGAKVFDLYVRNNTGSLAWAEKPSEAELARREQSPDICERWSGKPCPQQGLFGPAESTKHSARRTMSAESVIDLELTRATSLSWDIPRREAFIRDLREILASSTAGVELTQVSNLVMAQRSNGS